MSAKSGLGKEYQGNIFQFFIFLIALILYLFLYDRSLELFLENVKCVIELDFSDLHLLNAILWIVGFWGMIVLLNTNNSYAKCFFWFLLIMSSAVNFAYLKINATSFSYLSAEHFTEVMSQFFDINSTDLIKFVVINGLMIVGAFFLKPLSVSLNKTIFLVMVIVLLLSFLISKGQNIQGMYFVPTVFCYKYLLVLFAWSKALLISKK
jgi:hypothetical protein